MIKMTKSKPRIGISLRVVNEERYDEKRDALSQEWTFIMEKLDAFPILIPNTLSDVISFLESMELDGLILSGGGNIGDNSERDQTEKKIIEFGISNNLPIFGVCRGMQVLNKYFGGTIVRTTNSEHVGKPHSVNLTNEKFASFLNTDSLKVNSFHYNIIKKDDLGKNLKIFALSNDDSIEGFIHEKFPIQAVMWHPEREPNNFNKLILKKFFQEKAFWK